MRETLPRFRAYLIALALAAVFAHPAAAQNSDAPVARSLEQALPRIDWNPSRAGGLLIVDPAHVPPGRAPADDGMGTVLRPAMNLEAGGWIPLRSVAEYFDRRVTRVGSVTALTPPQMVVLETKLAGDLSTLPRGQRLPILLASLTPAQWRLLGSARGLGASDLMPSQITLWTALFPDPMIFHVQGESRANAAEEEVTEPLTLAGTARAGIRLRMVRATAVMAGMENDVSRVILNPRPRADGQKQGPAIPLAMVPDASDYRDLPGGNLLRHEEPNRLKPCDLDFDDARLDRVLPLESFRTVDDLVKTVSKSSGLEIYADPRMGRYPLYTRGSARAGDALHALCLALTGTFRSVEPAFVLTDDLQSLRARRRHIEEWLTDSRMRSMTSGREMQDKIASMNPGQYVGYAAGDPLALPGDLLTRIEGSWAIGEFGGLQIPLRDLPPALQSATRDAMTAYAQPLRYDRVWLDSYAQVLLVLPDGRLARDLILEGAARELLRPSRAVDEIPSGVSSPLPFADLPRRILAMSPRTRDEAEMAIDQARRLGWTEVWIPQEIGESTAILEAAIAAGRTRDFPVSAVVRVLRAAAGEPVASDAVEIGPDGETAAQYARRRLRMVPAAESALFGFPDDPRDWLRIDRPEILIGRRDALGRIASLPGLSALVLRDTAAPGYADPGNTGTTSFFLPGGWDGGYFLGRRLEFLRRESIDPIDLSNSLSMTGADLSLPFFADDALGTAAPPPAPGQQLPEPALTPAQRWDSVRYRAGAAAMGDLHVFLKAAVPNLPLVLQSRSDTDLAVRFYALWDRPEALPSTTAGLQGDGLSSLRLRFRSPMIGISSRILKALPGMGAAATEAAVLRRLGMSMTAALRNEAKPVDGLVLDLTDRSVSDSLALLRSL